jgi:hypothetical protein
MTASRYQLALSACLLAGSTVTAQAATFCVANPSEIQTAFFAAATNGQDDEIRIQAGTLFPTSVLFYAPGEAFALDVSGGWNAACVDQTPNPALTILDGADSRSLIAMNSTVDAALSLSNFTIRNGLRANGGAGALINTLGDVSLINMRFEDNHHDGSLWYGGGAYVSNARDLLIQGSRFERNRSASGGGVAIEVRGEVLIQDSVFDANEHTLNSPNGPHNGSAIAIFGSLKTSLLRNQFTSNVMAPISIGAAEVELIDNVVSGTVVHGNAPGTSTLACALIAAFGDLGAAPAVPARIVVTNNDFTGTNQSGISCLHLNASDSIPEVGSSIEMVDNTFSALAGGIVRRAYARSVTVTDNLFAESSGETALQLQGEALQVRRNRFIDLTAESYDLLGLGNEALGAPAGLIVNAFIETLEISDNLFVRNRAVQVLDAPADGGAVRVELRCVQGCTVSPAAVVRITNNTFVDNSSDTNGGAIAIWSAYDSGPTVSLHNNLFRGNQALGDGSDVYMDNDYDNNFTVTPLSLVANNLALSGGGFATKLPVPPPAPGSNYDGITPRFVDPEHDDYRLSPISPMVDAGDNQAPGQGPTDISGGARVVGGSIDVGAYEASGSEPVPILVFRDGFGVAD